MPAGTGSAGAPTKVAIFGGGPAGVAAAFWLSDPAQKGGYDVTLYSQGWRLGGKCASGRNAAEHQRIEEHGLHMLMGCYQNAFATLRACYDAWTPPPGSPITTEWNFYRGIVARLLAEGQEGKWVLIKGEQIIGTWGTEEEADRARVERFLLQPVLLKQVLTREPILRGGGYLRQWPS